MSSKPYMQLYVADYMSDTAHLSTLEHGAYLLLIMAYWQSGKPLPSQSERLANAARMSCEAWCEIEAAIREFFDDTGTHWKHKRIDSELEKFNNKSNKARESALGRYKQDKFLGHESCERTANAEQSQSERTAITDNRQQITDPFSVVVREVTKNVCLVSNQIEADTIKEWVNKFSQEWIFEAIKQAGLNKARSVKYVDSILLAWEAKYKPEEKPWEVVRNGRVSRTNRKNESEPADWDREKRDGGL